jgi:uncharacterized Zn finger protein (UPF0148 family)
MPNRHVTLSAESTTTEEGRYLGRYLGRILCPHCTYTQQVIAEDGCSSDACEDCGSPSESE